MERRGPRKRRGFWRVPLRAAAVAGAAVSGGEEAEEGGEGGEGGAETGEGRDEEGGEMVAVGGEMEEGEEEEVMDDVEEGRKDSGAEEGMYRGDRGAETVLDAKMVAWTGAGARRKEPDRGWESTEDEV